MTVSDQHAAAIRAASHSIAEAVSVSDRARADLGAAQERRSTIVGRIADLDAKREAIRTRRAGGDVRDGDGPDLALIAVDRENLEAMLADADAGVAEVSAEVARAEAGLAEARANLARAEAAAEEAALLDHAQRVAGVLGETLGQLHAVWTSKGRSGAEEPALTALATGLDRAMFDVVSGLDACWKSRMVGTPTWGASRPLFSLLRRLAALRGEL